MPAMPTSSLRITAISRPASARSTTMTPCVSRSHRWTATATSAWRSTVRISTPCSTRPKRIFLEGQRPPAPRPVRLADPHFAGRRHRGYNHDLPVLPPVQPRRGEQDDPAGSSPKRIPDGACLQLGIGAIPDATGMALKSKHDLGIHTEMFTDSMVELIECGAVNNSSKSRSTAARPSRRLPRFTAHL